ncbi:MAG TPA: LysR substrate-binding domain-containing protein [Roseimicrobium sp.]|nr:LysR substrate-binding domain-containing protein [Roseimicrobium sp.]
MELRHLRYFVAVAETENVSKAALKLRVSQPALSRQIRDLEEELGFQLLERSAKSVRLTDAGRIFLNESRVVLQRVDEAVRAAKAVATGGQSELHVGYAPTLTVRILPPALRVFQSAFPNVKVKLHDLSTEEMLTGIREGKLQLAFSVRPAVRGLKGLRFEELMKEPLRLAVAPTHPLAKKRVVTLSDAVREPFIAYSRKDYPDYHQLLAAIFAKTGRQPRIAEEHDGVSSLISEIAVGTGVAVVPGSMSCLAGGRLKFLPLSPEPAPLVVGVLHRTAELDPSAAAFLGHMRTAVTEM